MKQSDALWEAIKVAFRFRHIYHDQAAARADIRNLITDFKCAIVDELPIVPVTTVVEYVAPVWPASLLKEIGL